VGLAKTQILPGYVLFFLFRQKAKNQKKKLVA